MGAGEPLLLLPRTTTADADVDVGESCVVEVECEGETIPFPLE
jgi:hypothetical protein